MQYYTVDQGPTHLVRLPTDADVLAGLEEYVQTHNIASAWISYLGAVQSASLRYYDQVERAYRDFDIERHLEVLSGVGNVSWLDGKPFIHTHAVFADDQGRAFGGHLNYGCRVWALEVKIETFLGEAPVREFDERTGLSLWGGGS